MRPLSSDILALVSALERVPSVSERLFGREREDLRILSELEAHAEPGLALHLLPAVFGDNRTVSKAAAHLLSLSIAAATPEELFALDDRSRDVWSSYSQPGSSNWRAFRPAEVSRFGDFGDDESAVIGMASFHSSGWVREAAVTRLDAIATGAELPFLLLRLNDWVEPVAQCAEQAVRRRLTVQFADAFVHCLPLLRRLEINHRRDHRAMLRSVVGLLKEPACRLVVKRGLKSTDVLGRRLLFEVARERQDVDKAALLRRALRDSDTVIRLAAARDACATMSPGALEDVLPRIIGDPYPRIRREGVGAAAGLAGEHGQRVLRAALLDRNQVVREIARFCLLRRRELRDFARFYRERIENGMGTDVSAAGLAIAIAGLGETGVEEDAARLVPFLDHAQPAVRRASIRAIASLGLTPQLHRLIQMLRDPSRGVSHMARRVLRPRAATVGLAMLQAVLREAAHAHNRFDVVSVGAALGKWDSPTLLLEAAADPDVSVREAGVRWLRVWVARQNRSFGQPTQDQLRELGRALSDYAGAVDRDIVDVLRANHQYWIESSLSRSEDYQGR
jgi:HEAT repeat protein